MLAHLFLTLATLAPSSGELTLARIGGEPVTTEDLKQRVAQNRSEGGTFTPAQLLGGLVDDYLFAAEGRRLGLDKVRVEEAQLVQLYHEQYDLVRLQLVVLSSEKEAGAALERLRKGASLAEEARGSLEPRSKEQHGDLGELSRGDLEPALATAVFAAPAKSWFGPVALHLGFAVARVLDRKIGEDAGFVAVRAELEARAKGSARREMRHHYRQQLRAKVHLDEAFLASTGARLDATPADLERPIAQVNRRVLRYGDVLPAIQQLARGRASAHNSGLVVKKDIIWQAIDALLLGDDAIAHGHGKALEVERDLRATRRALLSRAAADRIREGVARPTDAEIEARYRKDLSSFMRPGHRACAHLVVEQRREADDALGRLRKGTDFATVARAVSRDATTASRGGDLGEIGDDRLDALAKEGEAALAAALRDARPGEPTGPVRSRAGFHVVRCGPHAAAAPAPLAELRRNGAVVYDRAALAAAGLAQP